jgi:thioredoxin-related protein
MKTLLLGLLLAFTTAGFSQNWQTDFEQAKALAAKENKNIILVFSGSDWCAPCIKLDKNIWQSTEFKAEADKKWILVKADFPKKKGNALPPEQQKQNDALAENYNKEGNFPLVVILDKTGKVVGKTGFKDLSAPDYIAHLHTFEKK